MANSPDINNVQRAMRVDRTLDKKIIRKFKTDDDMSIKDAYIIALLYATRKFELTPEDHEEIAREKREAAAKLHKKIGGAK